MLCFNYIANVIKLMRKSLGDERWDMLGRRTCRDMREYAGICGNMRGYAGICGDMRGYAGICGDMRGYAGICGTDHLSEIGPAVLPFLAPSPPIH